MNLRGRVGDVRAHHTGNGMLTVLVLNTLSIPFDVIEGERGLDLVPDLVEHSRLMKRPVCICLGKEL